MTHPNEIAKHASACYAIAIAHLLNNLGDRQGAYNAAKAYAVKTDHQEIISWFDHIEKEQPLPGNKFMGWAKIPFTHGFRHLLASTPYLQAMEQTLAIGGDTNSNCMIVGGLIGAAEGIHNLPQNLTSKVLTCKQSKPRLEWLHPKKIPGLVDRIVQNAPTSLQYTLSGKTSS